MTKGKAKFTFGGFEVETNLLEIMEVVHKKCKFFGLTPEETKRFRAAGVMLVYEGIKIGTIIEHKKMQEAYAEAIPMIMKCADFVEAMQKITLELSAPAGKA